MLMKAASLSDALHPSELKKKAQGENDRMYGIPLQPRLFLVLVARIMLLASKSAKLNLGLHMYPNDIQNPSAVPRKASSPVSCG
jgi:hypothetical protein